jgi:hypothetical protein
MGVARMPEACKVLFQGNREALDGFTDEETAQLVTLLTRLITNLDRIAGVEGLQHDSDSRNARTA